MQDPTNKLLIKLQESYITDYVASDLKINPVIGYTEDNIIDIVGNLINTIYIIFNVYSNYVFKHLFIATVMDYQKLLEDIERNDFVIKKTNDPVVNKDIDKLENDNVNINTIPITYYL